MTENIGVMGIGLRLLVHPLKEYYIDTYCGIKFGYFLSTNPSNALSFMAVLGGRVYTNNLIGINF